MSDMKLWHINYNCDVLDNSETLPNKIIIIYHDFFIITFILFKTTKNPYVKYYLNTPFFCSFLLCQGSIPSCFCLLFKRPSKIICIDDFMQEDHSSSRQQSKFESWMFIEDLQNLQCSLWCDHCCFLMLWLAMKAQILWTGQELKENGYTIVILFMYLVGQINGHWLINQSLCVSIVPTIIWCQKLVSAYQFRPRRKQLCIKTMG